MVGYRSSDTHSKTQAHQFINHNNCTLIQTNTHVCEKKKRRTTFSLLELFLTQQSFKVLLQTF